MVERTENLIIGAGVSGLAYADWLGTDDYLICEALGEIGGYCRTIKKAGFVWDFSGHFFHFKDPEIERYLCDRMKDQEVATVVKDSRVFHKGDLIDFPFQKNIHQLPTEEFAQCLVDLFGRSEEPPTNFKEMLYAKFGKSIAELFLIPYNEKLYATDLSNLDVDAMGRFFPYADIPDIIRNFRKADNSSYNATFTYPEGGAIQYINALAAGVDSTKIRLNERVLEIDAEAKVARTSKGEIAYERLVSSAPFISLLKMANQEYDDSFYSYNQVLVFNLGFDRKGLEGVHWIYFADRELVFYRVGFYDNIFKTDRMSLYVEIGYPADAQIDEAEIARVKARVLEDLRKCEIVKDHELVADHHTVMNPAYVHITRDSLVDVAQRRTELSAKGIHSIGRYGAWTYCSIEDNIVEARALAEIFGTRS